MVDYGMVLKNVNSEVLIDSKYRNLSNDESGDSEEIRNFNSATVHTQTIDIVNDPLTPLIAWQPSTSYFSSIIDYRRTWNTSGYYEKDYEAFKAATEAGDVNIYDYINWINFRENRVPSDEDYGLQINNVKGEKVFDSANRYLKIDSVIETDLALPTPTPAGSNYGDYVDITHSGISDPYYFLSTIATFYCKIGSVDPEYWCFHSWWAIGIKKLSSTSVRVGWFRYRYYLDEAAACFGSTCANSTKYSNPYPKLIIASQ